MGWSVNRQSTNHHHDLSFSLDAPKGHLLFLPICQGTWWGSFIDGQGERFYLFLKRIEQAQLCTNMIIRDVNLDPETIKPTPN